MDTQELLQLSERIETDPEWFISSDFEDSELAASLRELAAVKCLIAEVLDDPLVAVGAPPGIGWFERAESALGRPIGSTFTKQTTLHGQVLSAENKTGSPPHIPHVRAAISDAPGAGSPVQRPPEQSPSGPPPPPGGNPCA